MQMQEKTNQLNSALIFFFIAAVLGVLMRFAFVVEMPDWFKYKNVQHAHSHVAMMGWLSAAFYFFICKYFQLNRAIYKYVFWALQATVLGMLISFPIQGYAFFSILFSSLYMILSYVFIGLVWRDIKRNESLQGLVSIRFLKTSLLFMGLSTIGIWAMGPIMASGLRGSAWYFSAVQFFLHFQFNGWFIFALLALMFKTFEDKSIVFIPAQVNRFYLFLYISCILTYALSVTWSIPGQFLFWVNSVGVLLQGIALIYFMMILKSINSQAKEKLSKQHFRLWGIAFFCLGFKILIQTLVAVPHLATVSYTIRNFVIGFIHLLMLGALSTFLFGLMNYAKLKTDRIGINIFLLGILLTEVLLFGQGVLLWGRLGFIPNYHLILASASTLLPIGILLFVFQLFRRNE